MQSTPYTRRKLLDRLQTFMNRTDLEDTTYDPISLGDLAIENARSRLMTRFNFPCMEESVAVDIDPASHTDPTERYTLIDWPGDYKMPRELWISDQTGLFQNDLTYKERDDFVRIKSIDEFVDEGTYGGLVVIPRSTPTNSAGIFTSWRKQFWLFPAITAEDSFRLNVDYYKYLDADIAPEGDDFTDDILGLNDCFLYFCAYEVAVILSDPDAQRTYLAEAERRLAELNVVRVEQAQKPLGHRGGEHWGG